MHAPLPQQPAPHLDLPLVGGGRWVLADQRPDRFTLLVFYRGLHCPQCHKQLHQLTGLRDQLEELGVTSVVAVSGDDEQRATRAAHDWDLGDLPVAYDLTVDQMRAWGLYVSKGVKDPEPELFNEPGLFLLRPDGTVYSAHVQSTPFARPRLEDLVKALQFVNDNDYPARGEA
ncbi:MAG: peroxiredoxin-like family protein [Nocardioidaceae bacterium]